MKELKNYRGHYKTLTRLKSLIEQGRCPKCEIRFEAEHHDCGLKKEDFVNNSTEIIDNDSLNPHTGGNGPL